MDLYYMDESTPCRAVMMTAKCIGIDLNLKYVDLEHNEQMKPEFLKINPQHSLPTLVDHNNDDLALWESKAIMIYLVEKYAKTDSLYPKCHQKRAQINQRLYFDMGTLYQAYGEYYYSQIFDGKPENPEALKKIEEAMKLLNTFLEGQTFAVGNSLTLADITLLASLSAFDVSGYDLNAFPNVAKYYKYLYRVTPGAKENEKGALAFKKYFSWIKK